MNSAGRARTLNAGTLGRTKSKGSNQLNTSMPRLLAALLIAILAACSSSNDDDDGNDPDMSMTPTEQESSNGISMLNEQLVRRSLDIEKVNQAGYLDVTMTDDDASVLVNLQTESRMSDALITEIRDPDDQVIYQTGIDSSTGDFDPVVSTFTDTYYSLAGGASVFLPSTPELTLKAGDYRFTFATDDDALLTSATVFIKSKPLTGELDLQPYQANLNIWIAHPDPVFHSQAFETTLQTVFKDSINTILAPHMLSLGTISVFKAGDSDTTDFSTISFDDDGQIADACRAMLSATTDKLALNVVYAQNLTSEDGGDDIAGFSPTPGIVLDDQAGSSCFFVNQSAYVPDAESEFTQELVDQMMAGNILHEAGHFMSLEHPTEETGDDFDHLLDTPECDAATFDGRTSPTFGVPGTLDGIMDDFECDVDGGAKNFIFYGGIPEFLPFGMSRDQAKVLRRHPLFLPVAQ